MKVNIVSMEPRDERNMILVKVAFSQVRSSGVNDNGTLHVFVEASESYTDIRKRAVKAAQAFASEFAGVSPEETGI